MAEPLRDFPYLWVTWVTKLIAGEASCWYSAWYRARHYYAKRADARAGDLATWKAEHARLVDVVANEVRTAFPDVFLEDQNAFKVRGRRVILAGKADLRAHDETGRTLVADAKTGQVRGSDVWQVRVYQVALPMAKFCAPGVEGLVAYGDGQRVHLRDITDDQRAHVIAAIDRVGDPTPPPPVPSRAECAWCDLASCTARNTDTDDATGETAAW